MSEAEEREDKLDEGVLLIQSFPHARRPGSRTYSALPGSSTTYNGYTLASLELEIHICQDVGPFRVITNGNIAKLDLASSRPGLRNSDRGCIIGVGPFV